MMIFWILKIPLLIKCGGNGEDHDKANNNGINERTDNVNIDSCDDNDDDRKMMITVTMTAR